ncbi:MAG: hypothetical protein AABZ60_10330 [Planctomycetota bacterium]
MNSALSFSLVLFFGLSGLLIGALSGFFIGGQLGQYFFGPWEWLFGLFLGIIFGNWIGWFLGIFLGKPWITHKKVFFQWTRFFSGLNGKLLGMFLGTLMSLALADWLQIFSETDFFPFFLVWFSGVFLGSIAGERIGVFFGNLGSRVLGIFSEIESFPQKTFSSVIFIFLFASVLSGLGYAFDGESSSITLAAFGILMGWLLGQIWLHFSEDKRRKTDPSMDQNHSPK